MIDQHRFLIQFSEMVQINVRSTTSRRIRRVVQSAPVKTLAAENDVRRKYFVDHEVELATFARSTLGVLFDVYLGSARPGLLRFSC